MSACVVLGIDAAWTSTHPSGVAVGVNQRGSWRLVAAEPSYAHFHARADGLAVPDSLKGEPPHAARLLQSAFAFAGEPVDIVAIDMPLGLAPIISRRESDLAVTRAYARRRAATHAPNALRPGALSDKLRADFAGLGYPLVTKPPVAPGLIEVYPHPALIEFAGAPERLKYKAAKSRAYWPGLDADARWDELDKVWRQIVDLLEARLKGARDLLPLPAERYPVARVKGFEDALDAAICVAVGVEVLQGRAVAYGDANSAIWVPRPPG